MRSQDQPARRRVILAGPRLDISGSLPPHLVCPWRNCRRAPRPEQRAALNPRIYQSEILRVSRALSLPQDVPLDYAEYMSMAKIARNVGSAAIARASWGGSQNFLGAKWVEYVVDSSPSQIRERVALRLLSMSPHYFYDRDIRREAERNRQSRRALADSLVIPYLTRADHVLDYGCGPGYMAYAVAGMVEHVDAVDISRGVLACAKALNSRSNISYLMPGEFTRCEGTVDLAYSFAVVQHLETQMLADMVSMLARKIRPDGILLLHFAIPGGHGGWRTEAQWTADESLVGRAKLRYGLNCFGRSADEMAALVSNAGFVDVVIRPLAGSLTVPGDDDITKQHLLTARR